MKKSHRKDVIIARIIFAALCLALLALILSLVFWLHGRGTKEPSVTEQTQTNEPPVTDNSELPPVTQAQEAEQTETEEEVFVWTSTGVNMRAEPNTDSSVLTVLDAGTKLTLLGEEEGWVKVSYNGQEGYVSADYITTEE